MKVTIRCAHRDCTDVASPGGAGGAGPAGTASPRPKKDHGPPSTTKRLPAPFSDARPQGRSQAPHPWRRSHRHVPPALRPPAVDHRTAGLGTHPPTKPVLALALAIARLERLFHFDLLCGTTRQAAALPAEPPRGARPDHRCEPSSRGSGHLARMPPGRPGTRAECRRDARRHNRDHRERTSDRHVGACGWSWCEWSKAGEQPATPATSKSLGRCARVSTAPTTRRTSGANHPDTACRKADITDAHPEPSTFGEPVGPFTRGLWRIACAFSGAVRILAFAREAHGGPGSCFPPPRRGGSSFPDAAHLRGGG